MTTHSSPPDTPALRRRVVRDLLTSPLTVLPAVAGVGLVGAAAVLFSPLLAFGGVAALAAGAGATATRWLLGAEAMTERAWDAHHAEQRKARERELDQLDSQLKRDRDVRTEQHLRRLRELHGLLVEQEGVPPEVRSRAEELVGHSVRALGRTLELLQRAKRLRTVEAHRRLLADREAVIGEVADNVRALGKALDEVRALRRDEGSVGGMADVRAELGRSLDVARRVDARLREMEGVSDVARRDGNPSA